MQAESDFRLKDLIIALKNDRKEVRRQLWIMRMLVYRSDYDGAEKRAIELKTFLDSDFAREESRARDLLAGSRSRPHDDYFIAPHTEDLIASLIREHSRMSSSFKEMHGLTKLSSEAEKISCFDRFDRIVLNYLLWENSDFVPLLIETITERSRIATPRPKDDGQGSRKIKRTDQEETLLEEKWQVQSTKDTIPIT